MFLDVHKVGARDANSYAASLCLTRSSCMDDESEESSSDMDGSESPDLGDEWRNWRVDDHNLESDEAVGEGK